SVGHRAHEGGEEFLAIAAHGTRGDAQGYMDKEKPCHGGRESDASEQACEDDHKYASSVLAHGASPFVYVGRQPQLLSAAGSRSPPCHASALPARHACAGTLWGPMVPQVLCVPLGSDIQVMLVAQLSRATGCPDDHAGERLHICYVVKHDACRSLCGVFLHTL